MHRLRPRASWRLAFGVAAATGLWAWPVGATGTWTQAPASTVNGGPAFGLWLLTDGRVLSHGDALDHWVILTPDKSGSYANGTWKSVAASHFSRGGAQEHVLKDGRFFEAGGEYIYVWPAHDGVAACASSCTQPASGSPLFKNVETYDPIADAWTIQPDAPYDIGDTGSATLADGRILDSTRVSNATQIFDPSTNTWSTGPANTVPNGDENAWASLQNGGVLAVAPKAASIYDSTANKWIATGGLPSGLAVTLTQASKYPGTYDFGDVGGISLLFDGRVLAYGLGTTALYTPGATASAPGTWALGPNIPYKTGPLDGTTGNEAEDAYTVTEPNGKVMVGTHPFGQQDDMLVEFDPIQNTFAAITPPPDMSNPYPQSYLNLPNGQVMVTGGSRDWLYTPDSQPEDAWRPVVTSVTYDSASSTYTLTGTQLSGLINGADEGDDMTMAENYPIVWLRDAANDVYFCRSFEFSTMMPQAGSSPQTCQFTTPAGLPNGTYSLYVSAVGVPSKDPLMFTVGVGGAADGGAGASAGSGDDGGAGATTGSGSGSASASGGSGAGAGAGAGAGTGTGAGAGTGASAGAGASTGAGAGAGGGEGATRGATGSSGGCNCDVTARSSPGGGALLAFAGLAALLGRRGRRPHPGGGNSAEALGLLSHRHAARTFAASVGSVVMGRSSPPEE